MKRVLLTGGAGFIGSHAAGHFVSRGDFVVIVDKLTYAGKTENLPKQSIEAGDAVFYQKDICDEREMEKICRWHKLDTVVNFAAETHVDNSIDSCKEFIKTNVDGVTSLLNVARKHDLMFCQISTDEVYGPVPDDSGSPFWETAPMRPMNPYAATKAAADLMVSAYANTYGVKHMFVRPSNNYGPRQHPEKFIPKLIQCVLADKKFPLYGDGKQMREWTFVHDTARIVRDLLDRGTPGFAYNVTSGVSDTNISMVARVLKALSDELEIGSWGSLKPEDVIDFVKDRPGHDRRYWISTTRLEATMGTSYSGLEEGLRRTVAWYLSNRSAK